MSDEVRTIPKSSIMIASIFEKVNSSPKNNNDKITVISEYAPEIGETIDTSPIWKDFKKLYTATKFIALEMTIKTRSNNLMLIAP